MSFRSLFADMAPPELGAFPLGVTGTQHGWTDAQESTFAYIVLEVLGQEPTDLIHGGCVGVDEQAHYAVGNHFPNCMRHVRLGHLGDKRGRFEPGPTCYIYEPRENSIRNASVAADSTALIVVPKQDYEIRRSGTWATARMFGGVNRRQGRTDRPMYIIDPDGLFHVYTNDWFTDMSQQAILQEMAQGSQL